MLRDWLRRMRQERLHAVRRPRHGRGISSPIAARVQPLEPRTLLSSPAVGPEFRVNTHTTGGQARSSVAADSNGNYVIVWHSAGQDGGGYGIYAQRYGATGAALGSEFRVNTYTTSNQSRPAIAMNASGDFVVAWEGAGDGDSLGVFAQRYNAAGQAQGGQFRVNTYTTDWQDNASVAMDAAGNFMVTWSSRTQDAGTTGVYAQRFSASGMALGSEFRVNTYTTGYQWNSSIAADSNGNFVIAWVSEDQGGHPDGIFAQRYNAAGGAVGSEFRVNTSTYSFHESPFVAMDADGDFVVAWHSAQQATNTREIKAQRFNASGVAVGTEFQVNTYTTGGQSFATIGMNARGDFVIAWGSDSGQDGSGYGVFAQRYLSSGQTVGSEFQVNTYTTSWQRFPSVAMDADGDFVIAWDSLNQDGDWYGVYAQRFDGSSPKVLDVLAAGQPLPAHTHVTVQPPTLTVQFSEELATSGAGDVTNVANWGLTRFGSDVSGQISSVSFGFNAVSEKHEAVLTFATPLAPGDYVLTAKQTLADVVGNALDGDANGTPGGNFTRAFAVAASQPVGPEHKVNTYTTNNQLVPAMAMDSDGDYVVVWRSDDHQDGSFSGIYGQRYNRAGVAQGAEFRVNTITQSSQRQPAVAMDADGDFVVVWEDSGHDNSGSDGGYGIYGQRYNALGEAVGGQFLINTFVTGSQRGPAVAMDVDGDFVVTWSSYDQDGDSSGIYAQRFSAAGVAQGTEFRVNTHTTNAQYEPAVAMDAVGNFVIAWQSEGQDPGGSRGVYAQRYNAAGVAQGGEFRVNVFTQNIQGLPSVAMDYDGDFVIAWMSLYQDGSSWGTYARRYNASGVAQGGEFRVNTFTTQGQASPVVRMDADGDFVVAWTSYVQAGSNNGIFARRYNAAGVPQEGEFQVSTSTTTFQTQPTLGLDADGDFVVAWADSNLDGSGDGVYARRFENALPDDAGPIVTDVLADDRTVRSGEQVRTTIAALTVRFSENLATAGAGSVTDVANWSLTKNGNDISGQINGITFGLNGVTGKYEAVLTLAAPLGPGDYALTAKQTLTDLAGNALDGNLDGQPGGDFVHALLVRQPQRVGNEFQVNTYTTGTQQASGSVRRNIAMDADGKFIITWQSSNQDGSGNGVFAQRYLADGTPAGVEFLVNTYTTSQQGTSSVAMDADGDFVIAWQSYAQDGFGQGIYAQRFNAAGMKVGGEFRVNTFTTSDQLNPLVAMDAGGNFVITWHGFGNPAGDGNYGVYAQRYDAAGTALGGNFLVNSYTTNQQKWASVAMNAEGEFVVAWTSWGQDGSGYGVYAQRYDSSGAAEGGEFRVNTHTTGLQERPSVALNADGSFVVTWSSESSQQDGHGFGVYAQRYDAAGVAQGSEFRVNVNINNFQWDSSVAADAAGNFVIAWMSENQDGDGGGIYARAYSADGVALTGEFRVNTYTTSHQLLPSVAMHADGEFVVVWRGDGNQDGSGTGIFAQRFGYGSSPTDAALSANAVDEGLPAGTVVGTLSATDVDIPETFAFALVSGAGSTDNASFQIVGNQLRTAAVLNYAAGATRSIRVRVTDAGGLAFEKQFTIQVNQVIEMVPPTVSAVLADGDPLLPGESLLSPLPSVTLRFSEELATTGAGSVTSLANWSLTKNGNDASHQIANLAHAVNMSSQSEIVLTFAAPLVPGDYVLTAKGTITDLVGNALDGDSNGSAGGDFVRSFLIRTVERAGGEFRVNTFTTQGQRMPAVAMDALGNYVVVWASNNQDGSNDGVYAQRYDAAGVAQGAEFRVNTYTTSSQSKPAVAMDDDGDFVVTWDSSGQDGSNLGIFAQRYNAAGVAQGGEFQVNTYTTNIQSLSTVAMDADGDFVVAWSSYSQDGSHWGIFAQRYSAAGVAQGTEFRVNEFTTGPQWEPAIAMDDAGNFVISWQSGEQDGNIDEVYARRFNAAGVAQGGEFRVNANITGQQTESAVAMDADGDFVVVWYGQDAADNSGIYGRRYNAAGVAQGDQFLVNSNTTFGQQSAAVAMDADGDFVVTWDSNNQDGSHWGIFARRFSSAGSPQGSEFLVNSYTTSGQQLSAIAMDAEGDFVVAWVSSYQDGSGTGIFAQRYGRVLDDTPPAITGIFVGSDPLDPGEQQMSPVRDITLAFSENLVTAGESDVTSLANWSFTRDGNDAVALIDRIEFGYNPIAGRFEAVLQFATPLERGDYVLTAKASIADVGGLTLGGDVVRAFSVAGLQPAGGEFQANTYTTSAQSASAVARDALGNFVVVWSSNGQDGSAYGIYAQRFNAYGVPQGGEFRVNTYTTGDQREPHVAMDADGDFLVTWGSWQQDGDAWGIFAQRYNAAGVPQGDEFQVNTHVAGFQRGSQVMMDADGNFVIVWHGAGPGGISYDIYAQRYNAAGVAQGTEFRINTYMTGSQNGASIAMDADGDFLIAWTSFGQDGSGNGIYARRYSATGIAQGGEFRVNTYTTNQQISATAAMDVSGNIVVAWASSGQDGSDYNVYAQRYDAAGLPQGNEFRVNTATVGQQLNPAVAIDGQGNFLITWTSSDFDSDGVFARWYDAAGVPQGGEFRVNSHTTGRQFQSAVALDADGDAIITWTSDVQAQGGYVVRAQRFINDEFGVSLTPPGNTTLSEHGPAAQKSTTFDVVLTKAPASNVVLSITSNDTTEATVNVATLTFTPGNWNVAQTVTISGVFDNLTDGDQNVNITVSVNDALSDDAYDGVADQNVSVTVRDVANRPVVVGPSGAGQSNPLTFQWNGDDVHGETSFALWLINKGTGALVYSNDTLAANSTSFVLPLTLDPGDYRFWLNSVSAVGYSQSGPHTDFSIGAAAVPPAAPTGIMASNTTTPTPTISWNAVSNALTYSLYLIRVDSGAVISGATGLTSPSYTHGANLADGPYRIWVKAHNAAGSSAWSAPFDFTVGAPLSPPSVPTGFSLTNGETTTPTIHWGAVPNAATYSIYFIRLADSTVISAATGLMSNSFTPGAPLSPGGHRIWVKAHNLAGSSAWSAPYDFTIGTPIVPPTAPTGFSVLNADTANPTVTWESQGAGVTYSIWFINLDTGAVVSGATGLTTNSFTASGLTTNRYRIWVKAHNAAGSSSWSSPFDFDVAAP
jgi:large repetitive protein